MEKIYDLIIVGSGPAGMTAAIYAKRFDLDVLVAEAEAPGGALVNTETVENYPGFTDIGGVDLAMKIYQQMTALNVDFVSLRVTKLQKQKDTEIFEVGDEEKTFFAKTVLIATGTRNRVLGLESEAAFFYKGISWCAICDGPLYKGKDVAVIGGGNSALSAALSLSKFVNKVYLIHRRDKFRGDPIVADKVINASNIEVLLNSVVLSFNGKENLESISVSDRNGKVCNYPVACCFEEIGRLPNTEFVNLIPLSPDKYIETDENRATIMPGLYACGDVVKKKVRQIATAVGDGAIAALAIADYLS